MYRCGVCDAPAQAPCRCSEKQEDKRVNVASGEDAISFEQYEPERNLRIRELYELEEA